MEFETWNRGLLSFAHARAEISWPALASSASLHTMLRQAKHQWILMCKLLSKSKK